MSAQKNQQQAAAEQQPAAEAEVSPATQAAAQAKSDAATLAGVAVLLKPKGVVQAEQQAAAEQAAEAASDALADKARELAEGAENAAFAGLVASAAAVGEALGGAIAAGNGKKWLKELAAECGGYCWIVLEVQRKTTAEEKAKAMAELERCCGLYAIARQNAKKRVTIFASQPALCMKKGSIVKSQMASIRQMFCRVLESVGVKFDPELIKIERCDIPADKTAEAKAAEAVIRAAGNSLAGVIAGLKELGTFAITRICAELATAELERRLKVAEQQAAHLAEVLRDIDSRAKKGDTVAMGALIGATSAAKQAEDHAAEIRELVKKAA